MPARGLRLTRWCLVGATLAVVVASVITGATTSHPSSPTDRRLVSASDTFLISGSVTGLAPANSSTVLRLTATNLLKVPITVTSITVRVTGAAYANGAAAPAVCSTYLDPAFSGNSYTWSALNLVVAANNAQSTVSQRFVLTDNPTVNQDACQGVTFALSYSGVATYLETYATTTTVSASVNPPLTGQPVSYTAIVTAAPAAGQDQPPAPPTGTVSFTDGGVAITGCTGVVVTAGAGLLATAACTTTFPATASHSIVAAYTNGDGNFNASTSPALVAAGSCVTTPTITATTVVTGTVTGNVIVNSGQSYWLRGGTVTGNVTVNTGGQFTATGGSIKGNLLANGTTALSGTAVAGSATATSAGFAATDGATVAGSVIAQGSGPLCVSAATVGGSLTAQSLQGTATSSVCGSTIRGNLVVQSSAVTFLVGSGTTCGGNTVSGTFTAQADTQPVTIQSNTVGGNLVVQSVSGLTTLGGTALGNKVGGNVTVQGNSGGGTAVANTITGGSCLLQSNNPQFTGSANTVKTGATNTCNGRG